MSDETRPVAEGPPPDDTPGPPPEAIGDWVQRVRTREVVFLPAPRPRLPGRPARVVCLGAAAAIVLALFSYVTIGRPPSVTALRGQVCGPDDEPLAGALVFLASDPAVETFTGPGGDFLLPRVSARPQSVVVAVDAVGQEFRFDPDGHPAQDLGRLVYQVPARK